MVRPVAEGIGETMDVALGPDSEFSRLLQRKNPSKTTVSVWVYPDSFDEFESLKTRYEPMDFKPPDGLCLMAGKSLADQTVFAPAQIEQ